MMEKERKNKLCDKIEIALFKANLDEIEQFSIKLDTEEWTYINKLIDTDVKGPLTRSEPVGKWVEKYVEDASPFFRRRWYCTNCGDYNTHGESKFCDNCGARMMTPKEGE